MKIFRVFWMENRMQLTTQSNRHNWDCNCMTIYWNLWKERNRKIFQSKELLLHEFQRIILEDVDRWKDNGWQCNNYIKRGEGFWFIHNNVRLHVFFWLSIKIPNRLRLLHQKKRKKDILSIEDPTTLKKLKMMRWWGKVKNWLFIIEGISSLYWYLKS
jgi:hypothetical protein